MSPFTRRAAAIVDARSDSPAEIIRTGFGQPSVFNADQIVVLDSEQGARADTWHTDVTFSPTPPMASRSSP